jgi:hypothetical protein
MLQKYTTLCEIFFSLEMLKYNTGVDAKNDPPPDAPKYTAGPHEKQL